jgi:hypothetical protein
MESRAYLLQARGYNTNRGIIYILPRAEDALLLFSVHRGTCSVDVLGVADITSKKWKIKD